MHKFQGAPVGLSFPTLLRQKNISDIKFFYIFDVNINLYYMAQIGTTVSGTTVINLDYTPEFVALAPFDDAGTFRYPDVTSFSVSVAGKEVLNVNNNAFIEAYGYWLVTNPTLGSAVLPTNAISRVILNVANGNLPNQQTQIRLTTADSGQPIYGFSTDFGTDVVLGATNSINANANALVSDFDYLIFEEDAFQNADITFENGFTDRYDVDDIKNLLALSGQDSSGGYMLRDTSGTVPNEILAINNLSLFNERIASIRLYANSSQILNFATFKAPR